MTTLLCLGFGYSAQHYVARHGGHYARIIGTTRTEENAAELAARSTYTNPRRLERIALEALITRAFRGDAPMQ